MNALEVIDNIVNSSLLIPQLRFCLVNTTKRPFKIDGTIARPNIVEDFVEFEDLFQCSNLEDYAGIGLSIQASNVCAIDIDHCFAKPFDITSIDERGKDIFKRFEDIAYCEFSFSGTGMRILFLADIIQDYSDKYYIKNESKSVEYYQPTKSFRYVTVTGKQLSKSKIQHHSYIDDTLKEFLDDYMLKPERKVYSIKTETVETRSFEQLMKLVKYHYFTNSKFQDLWFIPAPGSGSNESERDYQLVAYLYENITQDKDLIRQLFETSNFYKTKDNKHIWKWTNQEHRYYNYLYDVMRRTK